MTDYYTKHKNFYEISRRLLAFLLVFVLILTNATQSEAKGYKTVYATTTVNIRARPNTNSKIVGQVYWNEKIQVIKRVNKHWYKIRYKGNTRYICSDYTRKKKREYVEYASPSSNTFKSYEDSDCITSSASLPQGRLKQKYKLDSSGVYMVGDRYCVAIGSFYTTKIGTKIDIVLKRNGKTHTLKCILADSKADKDTVDNHRIHSDGSVVEFVVSTSSLSKTARLMGDVSYTSKQFAGEIVAIKIYK